MEKDEDILKEVVKVIIRSRNEFWSSNITSTLLFPKYEEGDGKRLAEQWLFIAKKQLRKEIGQTMMQKKLAQLRESDRKNDDINLGAYERSGTVVDVKITQQDIDENVKKLEKDLEKIGQSQFKARASQAAELKARLTKMKTKKIEAEDKKQEATIQAIRKLDHDRTIFIDTRRTLEQKQKDRVQERITQVKREKTMTMLKHQQMRKEKTFIERSNAEDMANVAKELQKEAIDKKEERESVQATQPVPVVERENTDDAIKAGNGDEVVILEDNDRISLVREKTFARKERKKKSRKSSQINNES